MNNIVKTGVMVMIAISIVVIFSMVAPARSVSENVAQLTSDAQTEYTLQNLVKTYDFTQNTGHVLESEGRVDYCETE